MTQRFTAEFDRPLREWYVYDHEHGTVVCWTNSTATSKVTPKENARLIANLLNAADHLVGAKE
jgi:hypothetical protein